MTANFGCCERRTMASQPSVHNEDRNLLRLRAWEQRNQEASQAKELNLENVPLFGEPYKTNKGDELSNRIQRMLGSYEDGNPCTLTTEPLPSPGYVTISQTGLGVPCTDKSTKASFQNHYTSAITQKCPSSSNDSSQHTMTSSASSPNQHGHSSTLPKISMHHSQGSQPGNSAHEQNKSEALLDVRELVNLPQEMSAQSPDNKPQPFLHSTNHNNSEANNMDTSDRHHLESSGRLSESASTMDVSAVNVKPSPKDASLAQATKTSVLPSQTFPPLLSSKQPSMVMTQKPTAYVRPMDGQDQVVSDSPELKPSPEPYVPLPELISKADSGKKEVLPQFLETRTNEAQCVQDILTEMTHSWPPLLTTIQTPSIVDPSKSRFSAKKAEHVSSCPGQSPSQLKQQTSLSSLETAHCSGVESASSSDSECSSRSESDSESTAGEPQKPPKGSSVTTEPDAPAVIRGDWQLGNWIRSSQQSTSSESQGSTHVSESPARKRLLLTQSSKHSCTEVGDPTRETKPQLPTHHKGLSDSLAKPHQRRENCEDNHYQQSSQKSTYSDPGKPSNKTHSSKPVKEGCSDHSEAAVSIKCEEVVATKDKDMCFTERPMVKTKTRHCKKSKGCEFSDSKQDNKRTSKHIVLDKRKAETEPDIKLVMHSHCPSCGVRYPNPCSCPTQSHVPSNDLSHDQPVTISCSKPKAEATCQKVTKKPHKTTHKHSTKGPQRLCRHPILLLVKIDLSLLSRVPQTSRNHLEIPSTAKQTALVIEPDAGGSDATTTHKHGKKSIALNEEVDSKTLPSKKRRLENKITSSASVSIKLECSSNPANKRERKKGKKTTVSITSKDTAKDLMFHKHCSAETHNSSKDAAKSKDSCKHKQSSGKHTQHSKKQKPAKSCLAVPSSSQSSKGDSIVRPLLKFEDRQYPVKHYIKEAKRLKHKADAESDKLSKAFNYLDAAMYFVESGIAMEKDPQISMSSYTMFAETVELLKFVLKLKNSADASAPPSERDFIALCLKCQSLLQMAMFHHKHKTALKYSKILTDHFTNSAQAAHDAAVCTTKAADTPSPMPDMPSPANTSTTSGPGSNHSGGGLAAGPVSSTVAVPQAIEQMTFTYVNITTLFLSAHDMWEQAEVLAHKGSGMLTVLDTVMSPLSLTSTMNSMVRYTRQGVHWLRLDSRRVK